MFTGIVETLGEIVAVTDQDGSAVLTLRLPPALLTDAKLGDSYAVDGVCLTATTYTADEVRFDVMGETLKRSALDALRPGTAVNVERPVRLSDRLGGHLVQGHVDGVGVVTGRAPEEHWDTVTISLPADLSRYVVEKGSITVSGTSLTVARAGTDDFDVCLIPETLRRTTLGRAQPGTRLNLEVDVVAKYVERLMTGAPPAARSEDGDRT
jgi:riboflavin synthase